MPFGMAGARNAKKPAMPFGTAGVIMDKRLLCSRYFL